MSEQTKLKPCLDCGFPLKGHEGACGYAAGYLDAIAEREQPSGEVALERAIAVLSQYKHNGSGQWHKMYGHISFKENEEDHFWSEFETKAIAEKYLRDSESRGEMRLQAAFERYFLADNGYDLRWNIDEDDHRRSFTAGWNARAYLRDSELCLVVNLVAVVSAWRARSFELFGRVNMSGDDLYRGQADALRAAANEIEALLQGGGGAQPINHETNADENKCISRA